MNFERSWIEQLQCRFPKTDFRQDTFYDPVSRQILTTDMLVENVHFSWDYFTPEDLGWRSIAMSLSDIAATGGRPAWVLVSVGISENTDLKTLEALYEGIASCCKQYGCTLVGGDTVRSAVTTLSVTVAGTLPEKAEPGRRHRAEAGDVIAVSGPHGLSRAGLEALQQNWTGYEVAKQAHLRPFPQLRLGQQISAVVQRFAMMDSSDGLADAAIRIAEASNVDIHLESRKLAIHPEVKDLAEKAGASPQDWMLYGGEDFQLVVCLPPEAFSIFPNLTAIGRVLPAAEGRGRALLREGDHITPLTSDKVFQHFETPPSTSTGSSRKKKVAAE